VEAVRASGRVADRIAGRLRGRKQRRVNELERRYAQDSALIPYACKAKEVSELLQAASVRDAANQLVSNFCRNPTLVLRVVRVVADMEDQSALDRVSETAVLALCKASRAGRR
jgi:hypothetical protein